ncbi:MAG: c-type cytochrome [Rhodomicrobium sp.]
MATSTHANPSEAAVLAILVLAGAAGHAALAAEDPPAGSTRPAVSGGGVTLHSVSTALPSGDRVFPGGARAEAINSNCLACHSAGMVLTQPSLSRSEWQGEVDKMRNSYKAHIVKEDVPAIVNYLVNLSAGRLRGSHK